MKNKIGTITSVELAEFCGVSQGTVDRAINNRPGISPKTKERVLKAAKEYGYIKNMNASFLSSGKTKLLGLVVFDFNNEFFAELTASVEQKATELGYSVLISVSNKNIDKEKDAIERLLSFGVDGVILCPVGFGAEYEEIISKYQKPVMMVSNKAGEKFPFIGADDEIAMMNITNQVVEKGYKNTVLYIPPMRYLGQTNIYAQKIRADAYKKVIEETKVGGTIVTLEDDVIANIKNSGEKTAVLCASDIYALRLLKRLKKEGLNVPEDVGVTGFDNIASLDFFEKRLTTVNYPIKKIGETAVEQLLNIIEDKPTKSYSLECTVVQGETL